MRRKLYPTLEPIWGLKSILRSRLEAAMQTQWYILRYFSWWRSKVPSLQKHFDSFAVTAKIFPKVPYPDSSAFAAHIIATLYYRLSQTSSRSMRYFLLDLSDLTSSLGFLGGRG